MSNIQTGAERMPHDLSHLGFLAGQIGRLITISTTPVIAGDSFEMDAVGALRLSPLRRGLAIDSTVDKEAFKKVISRRNIRRRITIPLTLSNLKLLRRITRTENILHRNFTRRQVAIQNRVASNIGISQSTFSVKV